MSDKQWWEEGYERGEKFLNQPRAEYADKKPGSGDNNFGLWKPDTFYVPVAKEPERKKTKQIIFLDDGPCYVRQHSAFVPNSRLPSGGLWELLTCGASGGYYPAEHYEDLKGFKGVDQIPGNFAPCCGKFFRAQSKKGNPLPSNPFDVAYYTVLDCTPYTDKKGITHSFSVRLFPARGDTIDKIMLYREQHGTLTGCLYTAVRFRNSKSSSVGEEFKFESRTQDNLASVYNMAMYSGRKIADLYEEARTNPAFKTALGKIFKLPTMADSDGLPNILAPFNYQEVLRPRPLDELEAMFGTRVPAAATAASAPAPAAPAGIPGFSIPGFGAPVAASSDEDDQIPY